MWCKVCHQEVQGIPAEDRDAPLCVRCGSSLSSTDSGSEPTADPRRELDSLHSSEESLEPASPLLLSADSLDVADDLEIEQQLNEVENLVRSWRRGETVRIDQAHHAKSADSTESDEPTHSPQASATQVSANAVDSNQISMAATWAVLAIGFSATGGGLMLSLLSLAGGHPATGSLALVVMIVGLLLLVIGLVMRHDFLAQSVQQLQQRVDQMQRDLYDGRSPMGRSVDEPVSLADERAYQRMLEIQQRLQQLDTIQPDPDTTSKS